MKQIFSILIISAVVLPGCATKQQTILPSSPERETLTNNYMRCVADATNVRYNNVSNPQVIVRRAIDVCIGAKNAMIRDYPKDWQEKLVKDVDEKLYKREIARIEQTRNKNRSVR